VPANNVNEFIALAKEKPDMSYGSAGAGSIHHLTMEIFAERTGIKLLHVPYRGGSALVNGLLTGEIQAGWSGLPNVIPHIKAGKLRGLCVSVLARAVSLPDVPICDEAGIKGSTSPICWACKVLPGYRRNRSSDCRQRLPKSCESRPWSSEWQYLAWICRKTARQLRAVHAGRPRQLCQGDRSPRARPQDKQVMLNKSTSTNTPGSRCISSM
jgi:tripartite-type tricarboxylate transporter receptor subunit TctC